MPGGGCFLGRSLLTTSAVALFVVGALDIDSVSSPPLLFILRPGALSSFLVSVFPVVSFDRPSIGSPLRFVRFILVSVEGEVPLCISVLKQLLETCPLWVV